MVRCNDYMAAASSADSLILCMKNDLLVVDDLEVPAQGEGGGKVSDGKIHSHHLVEIDDRCWKLEVLNIYHYARIQMASWK